MQTDREWFLERIYQICMDYGMNVPTETLKYLVDRCCIECEKRKLNKGSYLKAFDELFTNFTTYRTINVATIHTALYKASNESKKPANY